MNNLEMSFNNRKILDEVSIELDIDNIYGFIGRNGTGKSTLFHIITELYTFNSGDKIIEGDKHVEYINDRYSLPAKSIKQCIDYYLHFDKDYDLNLFESNMEKYDITLDMNINEMSKGQKSLFALLLAISSSSKIILIDEIFDGLDKLRRIEIIELLKDNKKGKLIILVDHNLEELEKVIDKLLVLKKGKITAYESFNNDLLSYLK